MAIGWDGLVDTRAHTQWGCCCDEVEGAGGGRMGWIFLGFGRWRLKVWFLRRGFAELRC